MTLAYAIARGHSITVFCQDCPSPQYVEIDLVALAERLGPDHGTLADDLRPYFRCKVCGSKNAGFLMSSAGGGDWIGGSSN